MHNMHTYYAYVYELVVHTLVQQVFVIPSGSKTSYRSILMYRPGTNVLLELTIAPTEKVKVVSNFFQPITIMGLVMYSTCLFYYATTKN